MLTVDQIKNVTFSKARGGYSTAEVDDFIDQCVDTVAGLIEERNASNKKLEVLADKLVEYRNEEDSIRSALVSAQRLGDTIVREANQKAALTQEDAAIKAEKILTDAEEKANSIVNSITDEVKAQEAELARLKQEVSLFKDRMLAIYKEHLSLIQLLPEEEKVEEPAPVAEEMLAEETAEVLVEPVEEPAAETVEQPTDDAAAEPVVETAEAEENEEIPLASLEEVTVETVEEAPKSRFSDLKFGDSYVIGEDEDDKPENKGFFRRKK